MSHGFAVRRIEIAWCSHSLWCLESIHCHRDLSLITEAMNDASGLTLVVDEQPVDFAGTDPTCANVLDAELSRMDRFLFESVRPEVRSYIDAFRRFLAEHEDRRQAAERGENGKRIQLNPVR